MYDASKKKDNIVVVVGRDKLLYKTVRQPVGYYPSDEMFATLDSNCVEIVGLAPDLKITGLCVDRTNSMAAVNRSWETKYKFDGLFCALHILASIMKEVREPYIVVLTQVDTLEQALSGTKLGDVFRAVKKQDWLETRRERMNNNNNNNNNNMTVEEELKRMDEETHYSPGIPKPSTTRSWCSEAIILAFQTNNRHLIRSLLQNEDAQPYLTYELRREIIGSDRFWDRKQRYQLLVRLLHMGQKKWQGGVCNICLSLFFLFCFHLVCLSCISFVSLLFFFWIIIINIVCYSLHFFLD